MGSWMDKAKGHVKEKAGRLTGDKSLENEGKWDRTKGEVKEGVEDVKQGIKDAVDPDRRDPTP
jgi:uncharacterized protein YjbJ (UPF0337 family)